MDKRCKRCGLMNPSEMFSCSRCGEPLFDAGQDQASAPPAAPMARTAAPPPHYPPPYPYGAPGMPYPQPVYLARKPRGFKNWSKGTRATVIGLIALGVVLVVAAAGYAFWFLSHPAPKIDAGPPAGWEVATKAEKESMASRLSGSEEGPNVDYMYKTSIEGETIVVSHPLRVVEETPPDTGEPGEMEAWLSDHISELKADIKDQAEASGLDLTINGIIAVELAHGDVGIKINCTINRVGVRMERVMFVFCKHKTCYLAMVQTMNRNMDQDAVGFIFDNLYFE